MTDGDREKSGESPGLFLDWDELHDFVAPNLGRDRFRALIKTKQERAGFPPFRAEWGGFYGPRVREWLDSDNGVSADASVTHADDGPETFDATPRKRARPQARPAQPALLDGQTGGAGSDGFSGSVHRFTPRGQR